MRVKVLQKPYYYNRRMYEVGEELDMDDREDGNVDVLTKIGQLEVVEPTKRSGAGYRTAAMKAQAAPPPARETRVEEPAQPAQSEESSTAVGPMTTENSEEITEPSGEKRRVYRRRDMKPQE